MATLKVVLIILEVLLLFNLLIFVHELGHFLAARWRGLRVDRFAIWFGKPIWRKKVGDVEYALGWIPAGGYVSLPQMATMEAIEGKSEHSDKPLPPVAPLDKIIVAFAGPLFSFLLAVAFACVVWGVGRPVHSTETDTTIGWVEPDGPAWKAGLRAGDKILEIDGHRVGHFASMSQDSVIWRIISSEGTNIPIKYLREGKEFTAYPVPYIGTNKWYERKALRKVLIAPARSVIVGEIATNSPAAAGGLKHGDRIMALNGSKVYSYLPILEAEEAATNASSAPLVLTVERGGQTLDVSLTPERPVQPEGAAPSLGIMSLEPDGVVQLIHPDPLTQVKDSVMQIVSTIRTVTSKKSDVGVQQLGGPVMIIRVYKNLFEDEQGWRKVIWFSVVLNVNLALLNMLPLPVLDGGHILLSFIEMVRRRLVSARILNYIQNAFAVLLISFMIYIAFFDIVGWFLSARQERAAEVRDRAILFAPKK
jgi:regulator of sigma E protease